MFEGVGTPADTGVALEGGERVRRTDAFVLTGDMGNSQAGLRVLLQRSGLSQAEMARRLAKCRWTIRESLKGRRPNVTVRTMAEWAAVCGGRLVLELPPEE